MLRNLYYRLPPHLRLMARRLYYLPVDLWEGLNGQRHPYQPLKGDTYIGSGNFMEQGQHHLNLLERHADLWPQAAVLDVGSGIGRSAAALAEFLMPPGRYEGFDVVEKGVRWCQERITRDHPHFRFSFVPLHNDLYNQAKADASTFRFPYQDAQFDVVFLFSVFTHMLPKEIEHYLKEIARVLKPGGKCLATFFTYTDADLAWIADPTRPFRFPVAQSGYRLMDAQVKSANVALDQDYLAAMIERSGLHRSELLLGYWRDASLKQPHLDFQDLVLLEKKA
jgi:ubiquinone/menaquinone biosynthesis C-methylase UbiE